jgi:hypothetical protein
MPPHPCAWAPQMMAALQPHLPLADISTEVAGHLLRHCTERYCGNFHLCSRQLQLNRRGCHSSHLIVAVTAECGMPALLPVRLCNLCRLRLHLLNAAWVASGPPALNGSLNARSWRAAHLVNVPCKLNCSQTRCSHEIVCRVAEKRVPGQSAIGCPFTIRPPGDWFSCPQLPGGRCAVSDTVLTCSCMQGFKHCVQGCRDVVAWMWPMPLADLTVIHSRTAVKLRLLTFLLVCNRTNVGNLLVVDLLSRNVLREMAHQVVVKLGSGSPCRIRHVRCTTAAINSQRVFQTPQWMTLVLASSSARWAVPDHLDPISRTRGRSDGRDWGCRGRRQSD